MPIPPFERRRIDAQFGRRRRNHSLNVVGSRVKQHSHEVAISFYQVAFIAIGDFALHDPPCHLQGVAEIFPRRTVGQPLLSFR